MRHPTAPLAVVLAAALELAGAARASAAVIELRDGSRVEGTVVSATARDVTVQTAGGTQTIPAERIRRIDYEAGETPPQAPPAYGPRAYPPPRLAWRQRDFPNSVQILLGGGFPVDRLDFAGAGGGRVDDGDGGPRVGVDYARDMTRRLSLGLGFEYFHRDRTGSMNGLPDAVTDAYGDSILFLATAKVAWRPGRRVRPYLRIAAGPQRTTTQVDAQPLPGFVWADTMTDERRRIVDGEAWGLAGEGSVGLDFRLAPPSVFSLDVGWLGLQNARLTPTPAGAAAGLSPSTPLLQAVTVSARWGWRFQ